MASSTRPCRSGGNGACSGTATCAGSGSRARRRGSPPWSPRLLPRFHPHRCTNRRCTGGPLPDTVGTTRDQWTGRQRRSRTPSEPGFRVSREWSGREALRRDKVPTDHHGGERAGGMGGLTPEASSLAGAGRSGRPAGRRLADRASSGSAATRQMRLRSSARGRTSPRRRRSARLSPARAASTSSASGRTMSDAPYGKFNRPLKHRLDGSARRRAR